uniref:Uncharacterized protein n=1 Tax=Panagrolaimus sp. PS1159 TaxID=55785 RepID=A0AC35FRN8_9BILA
MQKEVIFIFALIFSLIEISFGIECYRLTQNSQDYVPIANQKFQCPPYVGQCFKFVCMGTNPYISKGCIDYNDPQSQVETLRAQCAGRPGYGSYYTCGSNRCNSAGAYSLSFVVLSLAILASWKTIL